MKKIFSFILISTLLISFALAEEIFHDTFVTDNDISSTNLKHVTEDDNGYLTIDSVYYPNAIAVKDKSTEYAVINNGKIEIYDMGETNAKLVKTIEDKNIVSSPIGITYANDGQSIWVLNEDKLVKYDLEENDNPVSKIHGLDNVMSITSSKGYETVSLVDSKGEVKGYKDLIEGGVAEVSALSLSGISNPLAISSVGSTDDIIMLNNNELVYYEFDDNSYDFSSVFRVSTGNTAVSVSATEDGFIVLNKSGADYYTVNEGQADVQSVYSVSGITDGVGISLKQDAYEYAIIDEEGNVKYYQYDGSQMKENKQLSTQNIEIPRKLILDEDGAYYISKETTPTGETYNQVTLSAVQYKNDGSITWYVDSGSGHFEQVSNGVPTQINEGNIFRIKAVLNIENKNGKLPIIDEVKLDASKVNQDKLDVKIIGITKYEGELKEPIEVFPVTAKRGSEVIIRVETAENVESLAMRLYTNESELESKYMEKLETGVFIGRIKFEPDELEGKTIGAEFTTDSGYNRDFESFINIESAVSYDLDLQMRG